MARVQFRHCSKSFDGDSNALIDVSLNIEDGEFMVLVGPSGCGKSTTLRLLAGLETPSTGDIMIENDVVNLLNPQQRNVAMVFQNYALYPHMTVEQNLAFPLKMQKFDKNVITSRVTETAKLLKLGDLLSRKPKQLSGGQRQRVAMGRALVRQPTVFLMDEPLSNLDAKLRVQIRADIAELQHRLGITMLYVTHDQTEALTLGDRVAVMNKGEIQQVGPPDELYGFPKNTFVADFIGSPGMNIVPVLLAVHENNSKACVELGETKMYFPIPIDSKAKIKFGRNSQQHERSPILMGVRPEHVQLASDSTCPQVKLVNIETLGHEKLIYFTADWADNKTLAMRVDRKTDTPDKLFNICFDQDHIHLFAENGDRI